MSENFELTHDAFFKNAAMVFFPHFGYEVRTEVEIFRLPKRADVVVVRRSDSLPPSEFRVLTHFRKYNILSFKAPGDRVRHRDVTDCIIYLSGLIRMEPRASWKNATITLIGSGIGERMLQRYETACVETGAGMRVLDLNICRVHVLDLAVPMEDGPDSEFLAAHAPKERVLEAMGRMPRGTGEKLLDFLLGTMYLRLNRFEGMQLEEFMPATANIEDIARPLYDRGRMEGRIETARNLVRLGVPLQTILEATGLKKSDLVAAEIIERS